MTNASINRKRFKSIFILIVVLTFLTMTSAFATNGYFAHGYGTHYKGMAGVGAALPLSAMAPATNPATIAFLGKRVDVGIGYFNPNREYTITNNPSMQMGTFGLSPHTKKSGSTSFIIPSLAGNVTMPGGHTLGLTLYGNGGMNTDYDVKTFDSPQATVTKPTGVNLSQLFVTATYARKFAGKHSIGVSGIFAYQRFKAEGLQAFGGFSADATKLTNNDHYSSTGFGARIGYYGEVLPLVSIGASYQTKIAMSEFDDYAGLFAEAGDFDIPATWTAGIAVKALSILTVAFDVQQIMYGDIKSIANPMLPNLMNAMQGDQNFVLGADEGPGFGWEDMTVYKFGAQLKPLPGFALRAGVSTGEQPIPGSEVMFNILAPGVIEEHVTFGVSKTLLPTLQVHAAVTRALSKTITGVNLLDPAASPAQNIELKMDQWDAEVGVSLSL